MKSLELPGNPGTPGTLCQAQGAPWPTSGLIADKLWLVSMCHTASVALPGGIRPTTTSSRRLAATPSVRQVATPSRSLAVNGTGHLLGVFVRNPDGSDWALNEMGDLAVSGVSGVYGCEAVQWMPGTLIISGPFAALWTRGTWVVCCSYLQIQKPSLKSKCQWQQMQGQGMEFSSWVQASQPPAVVAHLCFRSLPLLHGASLSDDVCGHIGSDIQLFVIEDDQALHQHLQVMYLDRCLYGTTRFSFWCPAMVDRCLDNLRTTQMTWWPRFQMATLLVSEALRLRMCLTTTMAHGYVLPRVPSVRPRQIRSARFMGLRRGV